MKIFNKDRLNDLYTPALDSSGEDNGSRTDLTLFQILRVCGEGAIIRDNSIFNIL